MVGGGQGGEEATWEAWGRLGDAGGGARASGGGGGGSAPQVTPLEYDGSGYSFSFGILVENPQVRASLKESLSLQNRPVCCGCEKLSSQRGKRGVIERTYALCFLTFYDMLMKLCMWLLASECVSDYVCSCYNPAPPRTAPPRPVPTPPPLPDSSRQQRTFSIVDTRRISFQNLRRINSTNSPGSLLSSGVS